MADISEQMSLATSSPADAAQHIDGANWFGITPTYFKESKDSLQPELDALKRPAEATPAVAQYISQSTEHAALAQPDVENLSTMEKIVKFGSDQMFGRRTTQDQINEISLRKIFNPDKVTQDDEDNLAFLNEKNKNYPDYGLSDIEQIPGLVAGGLTNIGASLYKHKELIAAATGIGAGIGAGGGLAVGGAGAVPGAVGGAIAGFANASVAAMTVDSINGQMGAVYNDLSNVKTPDGRDLDEDTKKYTAIGVGVVTGVATAVVGNTVAKTVPFLNKLVGPGAAAKLVSDPTAAAITKTMFDVGKSMSAGFAGMGVQAATEVFSKEFSRNYDGTEGSFQNAMLAGADAVNKAIPEVTKAAVVGGLTTGAITGTTGVLGFGQTRSGFQTKINAAERNAFQSARDVTPAAPLQISDIQTKASMESGSMPINNGPTPLERSVRALHFESTLDAVAKLGSQSEMKKLSPTELAAVQRQMLNNAGIETVHLDKEDLTKWASDEKKAYAVRNIIDPSGASAAALNASIPVSAHKFMELVDQYPDATELAKLNPEDPSGGQGKKFVEEHLANQQKASQLVEQLGVPDLTAEQKIALQTQLDEVTQPQVQTNDVHGEANYLDMKPLEDAAKVFMPKAQLANYVEAQKAARQSVVDNINETAKYEMDQVRDVVYEQAKDAQTEQEFEKIKNDPNLAIVDKFTVEKNPEIFKTARFQHIGEMTANHDKPGYSPFAIDPRTLTDKQKTKYLKDPQLKEHRVFVKGGISADDSARLIGVNGGENLLKILSATPSRAQVVQMEVARRDVQLRDETNAAVNLNETSIAKAYDAQVENAVQTLNFMKAKEWPAMKGGIKRIALIPPTVGEIKAQAHQTVMQTKIGALNANQFKVGQRKSNRLAVDNILKNQPEEAFRQQKNVAMNAALTKETMLATGKINRIIKLAKVFNKPETSQILKNASKAFDSAADGFFENAVNELLDVFNLNPSKKNQSEQGSFLKWAQKMVDKGEGNFYVPKRLSEVRQSLNDMTVEQAIVVGDRLKNLLHEARYYNKLYTAQKAAKDLQTIESYANVLHETASKNFDYKPERADIKQKESVTPTEKFGKTFRIAVSSMERAQHILLRLDGGDINGPFNQLFRKLASGDAAKNKMAIETMQHLEKIIDKFNGTENAGVIEKTANKFEIKRTKFDRLVYDQVDIPEFEGIKALGNGKLSKSALLMMQLNFGNEGNLIALERFGVDRKTIRAVLDRTLDHEHFELAQSVWDIFKTLEDPIRELTERTEGTEVKFTQPLSHEAKGRVYPGGHFPLMYIGDDIKIQAERTQGTADTNRLDKMRQRYYAQAQTEQGHLEARVGSTSLLDLDLNRIAPALVQPIHDLHLREPIRDVARILTHEGVRHDIAAVVGPEGYENITNMVIDVSNSVNKQIGSKADGFVLNTLQYLGSGFQVVAIAGKVSSIVIQPASLGLAAVKMGPAMAVKYIGLTAGRFLSRPDLWKKYYDFASEIHAPIREVREDLEGNLVHSMSELLPKRKGPVGKAIAPLTAGRDAVIDLCFSTLGHVDQMNKVVVVLSAYSQAINGEAPGIEGGNHAEAAKYASNIAELTQTHSAVRNLSPVQKNKWLKATGFLYFFNDANNMYNVAVADARKARQAFKETGDAIAKNDWKRAAKVAAAGVGGIMSTLLVFAIMKQFEDTVHGQKTPFTGIDYKNPKQVIGAAAQTLTLQPAENFLQTIPFARDMVFAGGKYWERRKTVDQPIPHILSDFTTGIVGITKVLDIQNGKFGEMNQTEKKALLYSVGYIGHFPTDAAYKYFIKPAKPTTPVVQKGIIEEFKDSVEKYMKDRQETTEFDDALKELKNELAPTKDSVMNEPKPADKQASLTKPANK